jgi:hypothetical protein
VVSSQALYCDPTQFYTIKGPLAATWHWRLCVLMPGSVQTKAGSEEKEQVME